ncbi:MAG: CopG family transcriptional regulator [Acidobacteriia bacterium]|nr:CopG family transcriptional regulator [Terriglobia bacterium]
MPTPAKKYQITTIRMPTGLYEQARRVVKARNDVGSLNELVVEAVKEKLQDLSEEEIDAAFAGMATDPDYQRDTVTMAREFAHSDWAAFMATEKQDEQDTHQPQTAAKAHSR